MSGYTVIELRALKALSPLETARALTGQSKAGLHSIVQLLGLKVKRGAEHIDLVVEIMEKIHPQPAPAADVATVDQLGMFHFGM